MDIDVLVPTRNRPTELATTLAGLAAQEGATFRVIVSDQSDDTPSYRNAPAEAMIRQLRRTGRSVATHTHLPRRGLAEHRQSLLRRATARPRLQRSRGHVDFSAGARPLRRSC